MRHGNSHSKSLTLIPIVSLQAFLLFSCAEGDPDDPNYPVPFSTNANYLTVWDGAAYNPFFIKGMNLGAAVPGTQPGELAITADQYSRWIARMHELGVNTLRIYTLHFPELYQELAAFNRAHPDRPMYLLQGIWLDEDNPTYDLYTMTDGFDSGIKEVVDAIHGNKSIDFRHGRAYGDFTTDVSRWVIGWVIGREIYQDEVMQTDALHKEVTSYAGKAVSLPAGSPTEAWAAARLDLLVTYERDNYGRERPISMSSWPTLDPIRHRTEGTYRREDITQIDLGNLDMSKAPGGYFATFHAYPYYPDFMSEQPYYLDYTDSMGPNSYIGYLYDLKRHYVNVPLIIGEFGVPSSWGNAHFAQSGMNHGGHDEEMQGKYDARMIYNIKDTGCGGGALFSWMDEWWKRTWIVDPLAYPRDRYKLWHNYTSPEQNFGLLAFQLPEPALSSYPGFNANSRVVDLKAGSDCEFFTVEIRLSQTLSAGETLTLGYDTYKKDLGESVLPCGLIVSNRAEFALTLTYEGKAQLYVTQAYDLYGIWHWAFTENQVFQSIPTDGAPWMPVRWMNNDEHHSDDWQYVFPSTTQEIGVLRVRKDGGQATSLDAVEISGNTIKVRLPWTLLQFTDPSQMNVLHDPLGLPTGQSAVSDGIALAVCIGGAVSETGRYTWAGWDKAPSTTEREKASMQIFSKALLELPDYVK